MWGTFVRMYVCCSGVVAGCSWNETPDWVMVHSVSFTVQVEQDDCFWLCSFIVVAFFTVEIDNMPKVLEPDFVLSARLCCERQPLIIQGWRKLLFLILLRYIIYILFVGMRCSARPLQFKLWTIFVFYITGGSVHSFSRINIISEIWLKK